MILNHLSDLNETKKVKTLVFFFYYCEQNLAFKASYLLQTLFLVALRKLAWNNGIRPLWVFVYWFLTFSPIR